MVASAKDLKYFLEVCQTQHLSRAAERIGISQPSLSEAMKRLESAIGTDLLIRSKTGVRPTKAGSHLQQHSQQLISLWDSVQAGSLASHEHVQGHIVIGCHPAVGHHILPSVLPSLMRAHPKLNIQIKHDLSRKILESVLNLNVDIGLVVNPTHHPDLILKKLYDDKVRLWMNQDNARDIIICDPALKQSNLLLKTLSEEKYHFKRIVETSDFMMIAKFIESGLGCGILPQTVALQYPALHTDHHLPYVKDEIFLLYRPELKSLASIQAILQAIHSTFKQHQTVD